MLLEKYNRAILFDHTKIAMVIAAIIDVDSDEDILSQIPKNLFIVEVLLQQIEEYVESLKLGYCAQEDIIQKINDYVNSIIEGTRVFHINGKYILSGFIALERMEQCEQIFEKVQSEIEVAKDRFEAIKAVVLSDEMEDI